MHNRTLPLTAVALTALTSTVVLAPRAAEACGCFAPPDPTVPVVQAGERIVFARDGEDVVAHIQIQYQGEASEFGWLLPLPSVPEMSLGTEELFTRILQTTQPRYRLNRIAGQACEFGFPGRGGIAFGAGAPSDAANESARDDDGPLVIEDSIGPYDYAVLRADSRDEMFDWLNDNRYFIPTGTDDVVGPYIRPGAYFLALKLRKGNDAGDIQPVVLRYPSELPMIPIILTSVAATPEMGVQVWVLGEHRAIPRNYRHTILNEQHIDWFDAGANYPEVVVRATNEAPEGQAFVTEYAGSSQVMVNQLDWAGRFAVSDPTDPGSRRQARAELEAIEDPTQLAVRIGQLGFPDSSNFRGVLSRHYDYPGALAERGIAEEDFYRSLGYFLTRYREVEAPEVFEGYDLDGVDPAQVVADLWERVVEPTLEAGALFRQFPKMTRMITTLSPEEMTRDPVFSFNPDLPDVSNEHEATFEYRCEPEQDGPDRTPGVLTLTDGRRIYVPNPSRYGEAQVSELPYSRRIEQLREEGTPVVEIDNEPLLRGEGGCTCALSRPGSGRTASGLGLALTLAGALGLMLARRRR